MERALHVRMTDDNLSDLELLAVKDRRRASELVRFAVEDYLASRRLDIKAIRDQQAADAESVAEKNTLDKIAASKQGTAPRGGRSSLTKEPIAAEPTLADVMREIAEVKAKVAGK